MTVTRKRSQGQRLLRHIRLLSEEGPMTTAELARHLDCQLQEVQRDRRLLRAEGHVIWQTEERPIRYGLQHPWRATISSPEPVRAVITHALLRLLHHHAPTPSRVYHEALIHLTEQLPLRLQAVLRRTLASPQGSTPRILETVAAAWCYGEAVEFLYQKPTESVPKWSVADIAFMEINRSNLDWYVFARRQGETKVKTFHLSRFQDARRLTAQLSPDLDFDPQAELDGAWGIIGGQQHCEICLRFTPEATPYVHYRRWPGQLEGERQDNGCYVLRLNAPLDRHNLPVEVMAWIRGWGPRVEVISPGWLRQQWLAEAREVGERYGL
ncbi:WYL domain-containing protein [Deinococcus psychrotolerans]|uniref:WYL domain-containing protein n=1 Tax=Deinococcus psychrotolerans TaxID=2489213 RepID=A0A3G8YGB6_9DEIO|nr:WYL domain-containing protein [Deinococcus psychrotolerans]AZI43995.1 WYL domain-containing protein [Deinococcus psychrotolerans]